MKTTSRHIIAELSGCRPDLLGNINKIREILVRAAVIANASIREVVFHKFQPNGVSGVVIIAESHLAIHTWPEVGYAALDIYTCGDTTLPEKACRYTADCLDAAEIYMSTVNRGMPNPSSNYRHKFESAECKRGMVHAGNG